MLPRSAAHRKATGNDSFPRIENVLDSFTLNGQMMVLELQRVALLAQARTGLRLVSADSLALIPKIFLS